MIRLENLSVVFARGTPDENTALRNISLAVKPGDFITVIGSNGAGKTSLYHDGISGTYPLHSGRIFLTTENTNDKNNPNKKISHGDTEDTKGYTEFAHHAHSSVSPCLCERFFFFCLSPRHKGTKDDKRSVHR